LEIIRQVEELAVPVADKENASTSDNTLRIFDEVDGALEHITQAVLCGLKPYQQRGMQELLHVFVRGGEKITTFMTT